MLSGNEIFPTSGTPGTGGEVGSGISFDTATNVLNLNVGWGTGKGFTNLTGVVFSAHLHGPTSSSGAAAFNENASIQFSLDGATPGFSNSATNGGWDNTTVNLFPGQVAGLMLGQFYLNVHTLTNPQGEIRGNLVAVPEPGSLSLIGLGAAVYFLKRRRARPRQVS